MHPRATILPLLALWAACGGGFERGAAIPDADQIALRLRETTGPADPTHIVFEWEYADERGNFRGEGSARVNPPDRFRLDLFSTADGWMAASLLDGEVETSGDLDEIELPPSVFLYAMAGVFRPGTGAPAGGFQSRELDVLEYAADRGGQRYFYLSEGRLTRVEERRSGRVERRIELDWGPDPTWPREARYRDDVTPSGVRWELVRSSAQPAPYDESIYVLPRTP